MNFKENVANNLRDVFYRLYRSRYKNRMNVNSNEAHFAYTFSGDENMQVMMNIATEMLRCPLLGIIYARKHRGAAGITCSCPDNLETLDNPKYKDKYSG